MDQIKENVQDYYGKTLQTGEDLKTNACCTVVTYPPKIKEALSLIHDEVHAKYYGCGLTIPTVLEGMSVLDLGSGAGRDCYILSKLVGENGKVVGIDMTDEQLSVANKYIDYHTDKFNLQSPNVSFVKGEIEHLDKADLKDSEFDIIVSNCVINLSPDKKSVLNEAFRVLKDGGEMYFSDVYADRRIPKELQEDKDLYGECLSGALYWNDFLTLSKEAGFKDPRIVEVHPITVENKDLEKKVGDIKFYSVTYRLFKIDKLENDCEDYGQAVMYKGTIDESPESFTLDNSHVFKKSNATKVCGNTYDMLKESRLKEHFDFMGNTDTHYGIFEGCGGKSPFNINVDNSTNNTGSCC